MGYNRTIARAYLEHMFGKYEVAKLENVQKKMFLELRGCQLEKITMFLPRRETTERFHNGGLKIGKGFHGIGPEKNSSKRKNRGHQHKRVCNKSNWRLLQTGEERGTCSYRVELMLEKQTKDRERKAEAVRPTSLWPLHFF